MGYNIELEGQVAVVTGTAQCKGGKEWIFMKRLKN